MDTISSSDFIALVAVVFFGAIGTYLLLPDPKGEAKSKVGFSVGLGLSVFAIVALARFWRVGDVELITKLFFYLFGFATVGCAVMTVTSRDPVHSALWFAAVVLATSGLFLLAGAQFLAAGTVIVYAGAIIVTFLFVIMLAQKEGRAIYDRVSRAPFLATLSGFLMLFGLLFAVIGMRPASADLEGKSGISHSSDTLSPITHRVGSTKHQGLINATTPNQQIVLERLLTAQSILPEMSPAKAKPGHVASLGAALFTDHLLTIELAGTLLFVALIGALSIATPRPPIRPASANPTASNVA